MFSAERKGSPTPRQWCPAWNRDAIAGFGGSAGSAFPRSLSRRLLDSGKSGLMAPEWPGANENRQPIKPRKPRTLRPIGNRSTAWRYVLHIRRTIQVTDSRRERALAANPASKLSGTSKTQARGGCSVHLLVIRLPHSE
jgi:hypothetical protein